MKRYFVRLARYTIFVGVFFLIVIAASQMMSPSYNQYSFSELISIFFSGTNAMLGGVMLFLVVTHPFISYTKRHLGVDINTSREHILRIIEGYGYIITREDDEVIVFNKKSIIARIISPNDDTIIIYKKTLETMIEGSRKALVRIVLRVKP
ncbi:MAG: hypothetical protein R3Y04_05250 [Rikenellaceae bacterium]